MVAPDAREPARLRPVRVGHGSSFQKLGCVAYVSATYSSPYW
jgi:hypothetical protein